MVKKNIYRGNIISYVCGCNTVNILKNSEYKTVLLRKRQKYKWIQYKLTRGEKEEPD